MTLTAVERRGLADAVRAEHAAVYAYGIVDAYSAPQRRRAVTEASAVHRSRRDVAMRLLRADGIEPPVAEAGYVIPAAVTDPVSAAALAAEVESETAVAWRAVLEQSTPQPDGATGGLRSTALEALTDCAVRGATWRAVLGQRPPTTAFPGQP